MPAPQLTARSVALDVLGNVLDGNPVEAAWAKVPRDPPLADRDRAFARNMVLTTLRRLGQIDDVIRRCLDQPMTKKRGRIRDTLRLGAVQMLFLDTPAHAAVDATVQLAAESPLKGLVNAVLRRMAREGKAMLQAREAAQLNMPDWMWRQYVNAYGEDRARAIGNIHLVEAPLDVTARSDARAWAEKLGGTLLPTGSIRLRPTVGIKELPGFAEGAWWVQDAAAAIPARLLIGAVPAGATVADLCAAPGGKTAQMAAAGLKVIAVDLSAERLKRLKENLTRLQLKAEVVTADAQTWAPPQLLDGVLLDAPCTATGTVRRHPEIPWIKDAGAAAALRPVQDALLDHAATMVKAGGVLIYSVCSLDPREGEERVAAFLDRHADFARMPIDPPEVAGRAEWMNDDGDLRTLPSHLQELGGMDGFYAARLQRVQRTAAGILAALNPS